MHRYVQINSVTHKIQKIMFIIKTFDQTDRKMIRASNVHKPINPSENALRPRVNFLHSETSCFLTRRESVGQSKHEGRRIKLRCARTPVGLWRWPQINDRDARDKITSRIKERRYVPITSTYLRDRFHQVWSTASSTSFSSQGTRCARPDPPTSSQEDRQIHGRSGNSWEIPMSLNWSHWSLKIALFEWVVISWSFPSDDTIFGNCFENVSATVGIGRLEYGNIGYSSGTY